MPIWLELLVLVLIAYGCGLAIGWAIWGRHRADDAASKAAGRNDDG